MKINEIQQQVGRGEYEVDTHAVADAIVRRMLGGPLWARRDADETAGGH